MPYFTAVEHSERVLTLEVIAIPEDWLDIVALAISTERDLFLIPLNMGLDVTETYEGLDVCGVATVWETMPTLLPTGLQLVKRPLNLADPYYVLLHDYHLTSVTANNAAGTNPLHIDNYFASSFSVVYVADVMARLLLPIPATWGGYTTAPYDDSGAWSAVADEAHQGYGDTVVTIAHYDHQERVYWDTIDCSWVYPWDSPVPNHMFVLGCLGHLNSGGLWFDCLDGYPSWGHAFDGDDYNFPGQEASLLYGLHREYPLSGVGLLVFSLQDWGEAHGVPPEVWGGGSRPPMIYFPPPYGQLGASAQSIQAFARVFLGHR